MATSVTGADIFSATHIFVEFSAAVKVDTELLDASNYTLTDSNDASVTVRSVISVDETSVTEIFLQTETLVDGETYNIEVNSDNITDTTDNTLDPNANSIKFIGRITKLDQILLQHKT